MCSHVGPTTTSRLSGAGVGAAKYWMRKLNDPNFHSGNDTNNVTSPSVRREVCCDKSLRIPYVTVVTCAQRAGMHFGMILNLVYTHGQLTWWIS